MEADSIRVTFGALNFAFADVRATRAAGQLVGYAPEGRIGIVEVAHDPEDTKVSLLVSIDSDHRTRMWSAICISSLAHAIGVNFAGWLGEHIRGSTYTDEWSVSREFGPSTVSAEFFPADILLITVAARSLSRP